MDSLFVPKTVPAVELGVKTGNGVSVRGSNYGAAPQVGGGQAAPGSSALTMRVGRGRAIVGTGGYFAPKSSPSEYVPPEEP